MLKWLLAVAAAANLSVPAEAGVVYQTGSTFDEPYFDEMMFYVPVSGPGGFLFSVKLDGDYSAFYGQMEKYIDYDFYCQGVWCGGNNGAGPVGAFRETSPGFYQLAGILLPYRVEGDWDFTTVYQAEDFQNLIIGVIPGVARTPVRWTLTISAAPEPASWALMITGFGLAGSAVRRRAKPTSRPLV